LGKTYERNQPPGDVINLATPVIHADTHVIEMKHSWSSAPNKNRRFAPKTLGLKQNRR
jgi:hypothetical protein